MKIHLRECEDVCRPLSPAIPRNLTCQSRKPGNDYAGFVRRQSAVARFVLVKIDAEGHNLAVPRGGAPCSQGAVSR